MSNCCSEHEQCSHFFSLISATATKPTTNIMNKAILLTNISLLLSNLLHIITPPSLQSLIDSDKREKCFFDCNQETIFTTFFPTLHGFRKQTYFTLNSLLSN